MSWSALTTNILDTPAAKIACLLFDEIVCQVPTRPAQGSVEVSYIWESDPTLAPETLAFLSDRFVPIQNRLPSHRMDIFEFLDRDRPGGSMSPLVTLTQEGIRSYYEAILPPDEASSSATGYEISKLGYYTTHCLIAWFRLQDERCTFLGHPMEHAALNKWFRESEFDIKGPPLTEMVLGGFPNLASTTWNDVVEMKSHPNFLDFRDKCIEVQRLVDADATLEASRLLQDAFQHTLREIATRTRPKLGLTTVRGVLSNLPMPIPVNPFSLGDAGATLAKEIDFKRKYGWLYFVLDAEARLHP